MADSVPSMIMAHVRHKQAANAMHAISTDSDCDSEMLSYETEKALIRKVLSERTVGLKQKERIATAILRGEFDVRDKVEPEQTIKGTMRKVTQKTRPVVNSLRHEHKYTTLELQSATAPIYVTQPKADGAPLTDRSPSPSPSRRHAGPLSPMYPPKEKVVPHVSATTEYMRQAALQAKEEERRRTKKQIEQLQHVISEQKIALETRKRNEVTYRRRMAAFRQKLIDRLRERRDPQATDIMRCIDDNMILEFMQRFKGCAMSTDAVLEHLGMCVRPTVSEVDIPPPASHAHSSGRDELIQVHPRPAKTMGAGFRRPLSRQEEPHLQISSYQQTLDSNIMPPPRSAGLPRSASDMFYRDTSRPVSPSELSINALRSQMMVEGCLPSLQPEVALSDAQLQALAKHTTTFENISLSVQRNPPIERKRVETINKSKPPRSLKTKAALSQELDPRLFHSDPEYSVFKKSDGGVKKKREHQTLSSTDYAGLYVITSAKLKSVMDL